MRRLFWITLVSVMKSWVLIRGRQGQKAEGKGSFEDAMQIALMMEGGAINR